MLTIAGAIGERTVDGDAGKERLREIWKSVQTCFSEEHRSMSSLSSEFFVSETDL